jgi:hypothetical protein
MSGIPREVINHKLGIDLMYKPIKQKERRYTPERCETIRQEVNKLVEVGFLRPTDCPMSYPVFMPKPSTHHMHDPRSIVPHIQPKVFIDN